MAEPKHCQLSPALSAAPAYEGTNQPVTPREGSVITILLERSIQGSQVSKIGPLLRELRLLAVQQPGFIKGQTFLADDHDEIFLVTDTWETWKSLDHWLAWRTNAKRQEIEVEVDRLLKAPTKIQVFT